MFPTAVFQNVRLVGFRRKILNITEGKITVRKTGIPHLKIVFVEKSLSFNYT